jgi:hypothetical protein
VCHGGTPANPIRIQGRLFPAADKKTIFRAATTYGNKGAFSTIQSGCTGIVRFSVGAFSYGATEHIYWCNVF